MIELLNLCGFEAHEIDSELPRAEKVFNRLGITAEDIERGKQRLIKYYDLELQGVRKILRLYVRELLNLVLAREEGKTKLFYGFMVVGFDMIGSAFVSRSKEVYVTQPAIIFQDVLGCIFDKLVPILEVAEGKWLKAGAVTHCANPKTILGLIDMDLIPKPDLLVTSGWLCETAPKTIDLLSELYDMPTYCYDTCQDKEFSEYLETKRTTDLAAKSMRRLTERMQEVAGFEITDDMLQKEIDARKNLGDITAKLLDLIEISDPLPISATHLLLLYNMNKLSQDAANIPPLVDAANTLYKELQERVSNGLGVVERGAPRILTLLPPNCSDPRLEHLIGELGIALVANEGRFFPPDGAHVPDIDIPKDPYEALAASLHSSLFQSLRARTNTLIGACKRLKVDGLLCRYHIGCRFNTSDALLVRDSVTKELGIPVLLLEWEGFDPRVYDKNGYRRKLELFKTILKNN